MVLLGYGSNDNKLRVRDKVDWIFSHFNYKHLHQRLLPAIDQFSEPER